MGSYFLFPVPSFVSGAAKAIDLWGSHDSYNVSPDAETADRLAARSDWACVARDFRVAMAEVREQTARSDDE